MGQLLYTSLYSNVLGPKKKILAFFYGFSCEKALKTWLAFSWLCHFCHLLWAYQGWQAFLLKSLYINIAVSATMLSWGQNSCHPCRMQQLLDSMPMVAVCQAWSILFSPCQVNTSFPFNDALQRTVSTLLVWQWQWEKLSTWAISGTVEEAVGIYFRSQLLSCTIIFLFVLLCSCRELFDVMYHAKGRQSGLEETIDSFHWIAWILKSYFLSWKEWQWKF